MKGYKQKLIHLKNSGKNKDILIMMVEGIAENSNKLSWLIGAISIGGAIAIALLITLVANG